MCRVSAGSTRLLQSFRGTGCNSSKRHAGLGRDPRHQHWHRLTAVGDLHAAVAIRVERGTRYAPVAGTALKTTAQRLGRSFLGRPECQNGVLVIAARCLQVRPAQATAGNIVGAGRSPSCGQDSRGAPSSSVPTAISALASSIP